MKTLLISGFVALATLGALATPRRQQDATDRKLHPDREFVDYWHQGKAEITRFDLEQSRYGETRRGDAIMVFVTEDFLPDKQVKCETSDLAKALPVLKLNLIKKFTTGLYDYSLMLSVFTPENRQLAPRTLKVAASVQEWCGQVWYQLNWKNERYRFSGYSYFEAEGDEQFDLDPAVLEDEIWTRIRIAPDALPKGDLRVIPGAFDARLRHRRPAVEPATATLAPDDDGHSIYTLRYAAGRSLRIDFEARFPHRIVAFVETIPQKDGPELVTRGVARERMLTDYWAKNRNEFTPLRKELGLK